MKGKSKMTILVSVFLLTVVMFFFFGKKPDVINNNNNEDSVIIECAAKDNYIRKVESNVQYKIMRNGKSYPFKINIKGDSTGNYGHIDIYWNGEKREEISMLRAAKRIPYLIYYKGKDYLYVLEENQPLARSSIAVFKLTDGITYSDNVTIGFAEEPTDPGKMKMAQVVFSFMNDYSVDYFHVGDNGKPVRNTERRFFYYAPEIQEKILTLSQDIEVEVFANEKDVKGKMEVLPTGTKLRRLRTDDDENIDMVMEDGRIARFVVRLMFSEPHGIYMINHSAVENFFDELR